MDYSDVSMQDFIGLGMYINKCFDKTASAKSEDTLFLDAYYGGLELGLGLDPELETATKVASQAVGREIMGDFISTMLLNK